MYTLEYLGGENVDAVLDAQLEASMADQSQVFFF